MNDPFLADKPQIIPPEGGWVAHSVYLVALSVASSNPVHRGLLHVGFLTDDRTPGNYSEVWVNNYDRSIAFKECFYLRVIRQVCTPEDMEP